jgi:hypothetical protein
MRVPLPEFGISLDLPPGWVRYGEAHDFVIYVPEGYSQEAREDLLGGIFVRKTPDVHDVCEWSERVMRPHVRQSVPEWENVIVDGSPGRLCDWTDGVSSVLTIFVIHHDFGLEMEVSWRPHGYGADFITEAEVRAVIESARWIG